VPADSPHKTPAPLPRQITPAEAIQIGVKHFRAGRFEEAEDACNKVLQLDANNPQAIHLLGVIAHQTGRNTLAVNLLRRAIALKGDVPDFHNNLGNIFAKLGRFEEAAATFQHAIRLRTDYAEAHNNLANVFSRMGQTDAAIAGYRKAAQLKPNYVEAHTNLGNLLRRLGRFDEVAECFKKAVQIDPNNAEAYNALALTYQDQGDLDQALATIDRAIAVKSNNPRLRFNRALMLLMRGDWDEGWKEYEWRWRLSDHNADRLRFQGPAWEGDDPAGRTILLHCEQGLGSTFQFIRFAALVAQRNAKVIVECQPPLKKMLSCLGPEIAVIAKGEALPAFDLHLPLMSLPRVLKTDMTSIPTEIPYLKADERLVEQWRNELSAEQGMKIGIAWQGNPAYAGDQQRSIPLRHYAALAHVPGVELYSLQKVRGMEQIAPAGATDWLVDLAPRLDESTGPFMDTAAVIANLDLIITSDTSIAHLAGALGAKVWVALPYAADWRWMLKREDCPWYPKNMRLFRQSHPGDWPEVFSRIAKALAGEVQRRGT
jgi:Flp pilus assembly protein TadD